MATINQIEVGGTIYDVEDKNKVGKKTPEGGEIFNDYENNLATALNSHAEGLGTGASGRGSHAEGYSNYEFGIAATGEGSHAEGYTNSEFGIEASGEGAHAEGYTANTFGNIIASGKGAHAEGYSYTGEDNETEFVIASGKGSHSEGTGTKSNGDFSHAEGKCNVSNNEAEHSQGKFNKSNTGDTNDKKTIHSIGIGTEDNARKNAQEVMLNGDHYIIGIGGYDGTNIESAKSIQEVINSYETITLNGDKFQTIINKESFKVDAEDSITFLNELGFNENNIQDILDGKIKNVKVLGIPYQIYNVGRAFGNLNLFNIILYNFNTNPSSSEFFVHINGSINSSNKQNLYFETYKTNLLYRGLSLKLNTIPVGTGISKDTFSNAGFTDLYIDAILNNLIHSAICSAINNKYTYQITNVTGNKYSTFSFNLIRFYVDNGTLKFVNYFIEYSASTYNITKTEN